MRTGFFEAGSQSSPTRRPLGLLIPKCGACGLKNQCNSPKMPPTGKGRRKILIVGEAPGEQEDLANRQFVGKTGQKLRSVLSKLGLDPQRDCLFTNALICRPPDNKIPNEEMVDWCRPNLIRTIQEFEPEVIIPLGSHAVKSLIGWLWKDDVGPISRWTGFTIPNQKLNAWICPTWHPSYVSRLEGKPSVVPMLWEQHLAAAVSKTRRPWDTVPDFISKIKTTTDTSEILDTLDSFANAQRPVAFDLETDRLKPDTRDSEVVCCSVSDGKRTISYPWYGKAINATKHLLCKSKVPKIGFNIKFEERWIRKVFGRGVRNWLWDGQLAAHILDNRPEITSLKFQAFVLYGQDEYDGVVKPYLKADGGGNSKNRIKDVDIHALMRYNGMDALLEWKVANKQRKVMGYGPLL